MVKLFQFSLRTWKCLQNEKGLQTLKRKFNFFLVKQQKFCLMNFLSTKKTLRFLSFQHEKEKEENDQKVFSRVIWGENISLTIYDREIFASSRGKMIEKFRIWNDVCHLLPSIQMWHSKPRTQLSFQLQIYAITTCCQREFDTNNWELSNNENVCETWVLFERENEQMIQF